MEKPTQPRNFYRLFVMGFVVYALPFVYFYAVSDLIETLKQPAGLRQESSPFVQWLYRNNQDNLMQYLILIAILLVWEATFHVMKKRFDKAEKTTVKAAYRPFAS
jgi:hypothetical protein